MTSAQRAATALAILFATALSHGALAEDRVLTIAAPWEITGPDPAVSGYAFGRMEVGETLLEVDEDGQPEPGLAESWDTNEAGTEWRLKIRSGVVFHDGTELTAGHAVHSLNVAREKPGVLDRAPIETIEADGDEVVFTLSEPFSTLLSFLAHSSTLILAPEAYDEDGSVREMIGTGPYRVTLLEPPQRMEVERFAEYWGDQPEIERAAFLAVSRGETRALMAESGDADIVFNLDPASVRRLSAHERLDVRTIAIPRIINIKLNAALEQLEDPRARQALSLAIDRDGIAAAILRQPETAAGQLFPPGMGAWHNHEVEPLTQDVERAAELLAELGWEAGADGILVKDGERFSLTMRTYPDRPELPLVAAAVADQLSTIGVDVTIAMGNFSEVPAGHQDGSLEMALVARNFSLVPDPLGTLIQDFGPNGGDWGAMNWSSEDLTGAMQSLLASNDPAAGSAERATITAILQEELPVIPVVWYTQTGSISDRLANVEIDPFERSYRVSRMQWAQ